MFSARFLVVALVGLSGSLALAAELVGVPGTNVHFPTVVAVKVGDQPVTLTLTGTALRKKLLFDIYCIASYIQEGATARTAEEVIAADCPKRLHLILERELTGAELADAFRSAVRMNHPAPAFEPELNRLTEYLKPLTGHKGDQVYLTHVPGVGLHCEIVGHAETTITNPAFARAVWEIYLGKNNLGDEIKKGLLSRR
jgi:hypothetical protein